MQHYSKLCNLSFRFRLYTYVRHSSLEKPDHHNVPTLLAQKMLWDSTSFQWNHVLEWNHPLEIMAKGVWVRVRANSRYVRDTASCSFT